MAAGPGRFSAAQAAAARMVGALDQLDLVAVDTVK
jgi:hypothetical protein